MTGLLVAVEGPKAVGKSTLIDQLRADDRTADWLFTKEPTDSFDLSNEQREVGVELATLIAADRARHVREVIEPALHRDRTVVTDRYVLSSYAFHCPDGVDELVVSDLNRHFPRPDTLLVLQCAPRTLTQRRSRMASPTRLSSAISVEEDLLGYLTHARECRPASGEVLIGYNESMKDCRLIATRLIAEISYRRLLS